MGMVGTGDFGEFFKQANLSVKMTRLIIDAKSSKKHDGQN
jgi:hypothetical protein